MTCESLACRRPLRRRPRRVSFLRILGSWPRRRYRDAALAHGVARFLQGTRRLLRFACLLGLHELRLHSTKACCPRAHSLPPRTPSTARAIAETARRDAHNDLLRAVVGRRVVARVAPLEDAEDDVEERHRKQRREHAAHDAAHHVDLEPVQTVREADRSRSCSCTAGLPHAAAVAARVLVHDRVGRRGVVGVVGHADDHELDRQPGVEELHDLLDREHVVILRRCELWTTHTHTGEAGVGGRRVWA
eukprot:3165650-Prymnesium_polylepis.2